MYCRHWFVKVIILSNLFESTGDGGEFTSSINESTDHEQSSLDDPSPKGRLVSILAYTLPISGEMEPTYYQNGRASNLKARIIESGNRVPSM